MLACEAAQAVAAGSLVLALWLNIASVVHMVVVAAVFGVCGALFEPAEDATLPSLVSDEHDHFYSRTALMYVFAGQMRLQDTEPYDRGRLQHCKVVGLKPHFGFAVGFLYPLRRTSSTLDPRYRGFDT